MRGESSRPELFFIYGIVVSAIVLTIFITKVTQLSNMDDIIGDYYANELSLVVDVASARSGYVRIPYSIARLETPALSLNDRVLGLFYGPGSSEPQEKRDVLPFVTPSRSDSSDGAIVSVDRVVRLEEKAECSDSERSSLVIGDTVEANIVTIIVNDPSHGCLEFERILAERIEANTDNSGSPNVQRVIVERTLPREVVILAR